MNCLFCRAVAALSLWSVVNCYNSSAMSILNDLYESTLGSSWTYQDNDSAIKWNFTIDESGTYIYNMCLDMFAGVECENEVIKLLDVTNFGLTGQLSSSLGHLTSVDGISLSMNHITGTIPTSLGQLSVVKWLDFSNNTFSGSLPNELCQLNVNTIDISENPYITCYDQCFDTTGIYINCDDEIYYC